MVTFAPGTAGSPHSGQGGLGQENISGIAERLGRCRLPGCVTLASPLASLSFNLRDVSWDVRPLSPSCVACGVRPGTQHDVSQPFPRTSLEGPHKAKHTAPTGPIRHLLPRARSQDKDISKGGRPLGKHIWPDSKPSQEEISHTLLKAGVAAAGIFLARSFLSYAPCVRLPGVNIRSRFCSKSCNIFCTSWSASITWKLNTQSQAALGFSTRLPSKMTRERELEAGGQGEAG